MNPCVFIISSFLLLNLETPIANHLVGDDTDGGKNKCLDKERHALLHFKAPLQDPDGSLSSWTAGEPDYCIWSGVTCSSQTGHVTELEISDYNIGGEISHSLLTLTYLSYLDLSYNSFNGTIPRSIFSLTRLRYLDLSYNSLYGIIPPEFGNLTNLQVLNLGYLLEGVELRTWSGCLLYLIWRNLLWMGFPWQKKNHWVNVILSLRNLSYLSLWGSDLSQVMYPYFSSFLNSSSSIEHLYLGNSSLTSSMYPWLFPLTSTKLRDLELSSNMLNEIPKYFGNLCNLGRLSIDINSAVVKFLDFLNVSGCMSLTLQSSSATRSQFIGSLSDEIQKLSSLEYLEVSYNHLNGSISGKLWELPRLREIDVSFNNIRASTMH